MDFKISTRSGKINNNNKGIEKGDFRKKIKNQEHDLEKSRNDHCMKWFIFNKLKKY